MTIGPARVETFPDPGSLTSAEKLELCVDRICRGEGIPPFAEHAKELLARSLEPDGGSAHLARVILKDVGLTSQLLRVANSSLYNRSGKPIISIAHGITLIGWDTVRQIVSAMRFVEHYAKQSPGLRELMMLALLSATHGRQAACTVGYGRPEEAYVCGLFRNIGEVLIARYHGSSYAQMVGMMHREHIADSVAAMRVFDFRIDDVSRRLAELWNLPAPVRMCLNEGRSAETAEERCLASVIAYGHELTAALYRRSARIEHVKLQAVLDPNGRRCTISQRDLRRIVDCAVNDTRHTFTALRIPIADLHLERQAQQAQEMLEGTGNQFRVEYNLEALDSSIRDVSGAIDTPSFDVTKVVQHSLDVLTTHGGFDRAVFALMSEDRMALRGKLSSGVLQTEVLNRFSFSLLRGDAALHPAITRKHDLWINRATDARYETSRIVSAFESSQFALFPVVVDNVVAGALFADRRALQVPEDIRTRVEEVRAIIAKAISRKRLV
jgi:HD-like signal output (HDOD) protein